MKIHLRQIPQGDTIHLEQEVDPAFLELETVEAVAASPVRCSFDIGLSGSGLFVTGRVEILVQQTCGKCLRPFETAITIPDFATQIELDGHESVDLTPEIREDILLLLPSHPRCDVDGSTTCPATFQSAPNAPLTEETDHTAWDALDQFKPKK